jgi:hypothetical protein
VSARLDREGLATATPESGTRDKTYDLIAVTHLCLEHVRRHRRGTVLAVLGRRIV